MARLGVFSVALLCVCLAGHAEDSREPSGLTFWAQPLSAPVLPLGPLDSASSAGERRADASDQPGERDEAQQPESSEELSAAVAAQLDAIEAEQAQSGERSPELIAKLAALASSYEKLGDYRSADAALQHAIEIARIDFGLHSLDQADVVETLVVARQTSGDYGGAAEKRRYLRELVSRNSHDPRVVGILTEMAEQEMENARRLMGVPAPAQISITSGGGAGAAPPTPSLSALHAARFDYIAAIQAAVRTHNGNIADLSALQDALSDTVYFELAHPEILGPGRAKSPWYAGGNPTWSPTLGYTGGQILGHKARDSMSSGRSAVDVAKNLLALADWYLVFGSYKGATGGGYQSKSYGPALDTYRMARDLLVKSNVPRETIDELLSPEVPPAVPVLPESIVGTVHDRVLRGYIDASVEFSRFGDVKHVEVLGRSAGVSKDIEEQLRRYVAERTFRPRFVNGELPRSDRFAARFYFD